MLEVPAPPPDEVVEETRADLAALAARHAGAPRDEIRAIHLLGLERKQIVAMAYRPEALHERLASLPVDEASRAAIRHAMGWIWREEQMHATFVRGVLLRVGGPVQAARAFVHQAMGAVAGWAAATPR